MFRLVSSLAVSISSRLVTFVSLPALRSSHLFVQQTPSQSFHNYFPSQHGEGLPWIKECRHSLRRRRRKASPSERKSKAISVTIAPLPPPPPACIPSDQGKKAKGKKIAPPIATTCVESTTAYSTVLVELYFLPNLRRPERLRYCRRGEGGEKFPSLSPRPPP